MDIEPKNNTLLLFPSQALHEVRPITCPSQAFADGRFTLNGWFCGGAATKPQVSTQ